MGKFSLAPSAVGQHNDFNFMLFKGLSIPDITRVLCLVFNKFKRGAFTVSIHAL
jgi:hypothetical protein